MGASINVGVEHSLQAGTGTGGDGVGAARSDTYGSGTGVGVTVAYEGLTLGAYGAERENKNPGAVDDVQDEFNGSWFVNYNFGPVSVGYQETYFDSGVTHNATAAPLTTTNVKTVGSAGGIFTGEAMSIAFNVNDNLSISYSEVEDTYDAQSNVKGGTEVADVVQKTESLQVAYSMGSMSVKAYSTETSNPNFDSDADKLNVNEIALGLAF